MKEYPSIPRTFMEFDAYCFDKIDGSNLRFEWTKKNGWSKFGTRTRLFDETDPDFGIAIPLFKEKYVSDLEKIIKKQRWQRALIFMEFVGEHSFAGVHTSEPKTLTLFDVAYDKKDIISPKDFMKLFGKLDFVVKFLGRRKWNKELLQEVKENKLEGISFEGIVGKAVIKNRLIMRKAKTQQWIDAVKKKYDKENALKIINS